MGPERSCEGGGGGGGGNIVTTPSHISGLKKTEFAKTMALFCMETASKALTIFNATG